ncbi:hypothetical protein LINPERHAP1_LOCUS31048 [Linum perenne]
MQNHSHCAKLNRVPFPLYDALAFVYGKGRATGKTAVGLEELNQACPPIDEPDWIDTEEVNDHAQARGAHLSADAVCMYLLTVDVAALGTFDMLSMVAL